MFTITRIAQPDTVEEAYETLMRRRSNAILGGCSFLKMGSQQIDTGIDLSNLGLNYIAERDGFVEIGATTTLRQIETHPCLMQKFSGILPVAVKQIIGIQFRQVALLGASVFSRYGFSDLLTALLVLDTEVELYKSGRMPLVQFIQQPLKRDILTRIFIKDSACKASYQSLRNSASDYSILNAAVSRTQEQWFIAVGARPGRATCAVGAAAVLNSGMLCNEQMDEAAEFASEEISFGSNLRGSAEYRRSLCKVLIKRAIQEVVICE